MILRGKIAIPDSVVIAAIDEESLEKEGRWPWSRDKMGNLVNVLSDYYGVELIVFDILFSEEEKNDKLFADAIYNAGNVLLPMIFDFEEKRIQGDLSYLKDFSISSIYPTKNKVLHTVQAKGLKLPIDSLVKGVMGLGHINVIPDIDGTLRWELSLISYNNKFYPSLDILCSAIFLGIPLDKIIIDPSKGIILGKKRYIPTDKWGRMLINYFGPVGSFPYISISKILKKEVPPDKLMGKIVIVGATAPGLYDLRVSPLSPVMPGVEKHANVVASILKNNFLKKVEEKWDLFFLIVSGVLVSFLFFRLRAQLLFFSGLFGMGIVFFIGYTLFVYKGLWINLTYPMMNILSISITMIVYKYVVEEKKGREIKSMFSSYVTETIVNELIKNPDMAKLGGERREVTIMFSDVRGFTTFSEEHSPEEVVSILNELLGSMTEVIFKWEGTLDKFIGDAIMAFWGAPVTQFNHAYLAVRCAIDMIKRLDDLNKKWEKEGMPKLRIGIGINTGDVLVGNIGAEGKKKDYTIIGDNVNLASRVEGLTKKYGADILITEYTLEKIRLHIEKGDFQDVSIQGIEKVVVKGKKKAIGLYKIDVFPADKEYNFREITSECVKIMTEK